jgi:hypothetical protein
MVFVRKLISLVCIQGHIHFRQLYCSRQIAVQGVSLRRLHHDHTALLLLAVRLSLWRVHNSEYLSECMTPENPMSYTSWEEYSSTTFNNNTIWVSFLILKNSYRSASNPCLKSEFIFTKFDMEFVPPQAAQIRTQSVFTEWRTHETLKLPTLKMPLDRLRATNAFQNFI